MFFKVGYRVGLLFLIMGIVLIRVVQTIQVPAQVCEERSLMENHPLGRSSSVQLCMDRKNNPLSVSVKGGPFIPIPIHGNLWGNPIWSPHEDQFAFIVRDKWGGSIIYSYFIYDTYTGKVRYLYRSPTHYGLIWQDELSLLFGNLDTQHMCYRYYLVSGNQLVEHKVMTLPITVQCTSNMCINVRTNTNLC